MFRSVNGDALLRYPLPMTCGSVGPREASPSFGITNPFWLGRSSARGGRQEFNLLAHNTNPSGLTLGSSQPGGVRTMSQGVLAPGGLIGDGSLLEVCLLRYLP